MEVINPLRFKQLCGRWIKYTDLGYKNFFFTDDNFAQNPAEAIALCRAIGDYKRKFRKNIEIIVQVRTEVAEDDALIEAMRWAGVTTLAIGYESPINEENYGQCAKA